MADRARKFLTYLVFAVFTAVLPASGVDICFDVSKTGGVADGFGAQIWSGDVSAAAVLSDLGLKYIRMEIGPTWSSIAEDPPTDQNRQSFDDYFARNYSTSRRINMQTSWSIVQNLGVIGILNQFHVPNAWCSLSPRTLKVENHYDYALLWGATIAYLNSYGIRPAYIELFNEPNGGWNCIVPPSDYNNVIKLVRAELDYRGFGDIEIIGPGNSRLSGADEWIDALDEDGVDSLGGFSFHAWDDESLPDIWVPFANALKQKDPYGEMPVFVTEFMTETTTYHGVTYPSPGGNYPYSASSTIPFAVQVFKNSLLLYNCGAGRLILWEAADQSWSDNSWGLVDRVDSPRPVYYAVKTLSTKVPEGADILVPALQDEDVYSAGFVKDGNIIIAIANTTQYQQNKTLKINSVSDLQFTGAVAFEGEPGNEIVNKSLAVNYDNTIDINMPPDSTLTIVCSYTYDPQQDPGKVLQWHLEENTLDSSGNENHAAVTGITVYNDGVFGKCLFFDGTLNPIIEVTDAVSIPIYFNSSWSMNIWVQPSAAISSGGTYHGLGLAGFGIGDWDLNQDRERTIGNWGFGSGICFYSTGMMPCSAYTVYDTGLWQMITVTYDHDLWFENDGDNTGDSLKIYKNASLIGSFNPQDAYYSGGFRTAEPIVNLVPATNHISPNNFAGKLDEFTIYDRALSQQQIDDLLSGPVTGDLNGDLTVDFYDLQIFMGNWLEDFCQPADIDIDCDVDMDDFALMAEMLFL